MFEDTKGVVRIRSNTKNNLLGPKCCNKTPVFSPCCYSCSSYINFLIKGLGNVHLPGNATYTSVTRTKGEILDYHRFAFGISTKDEKKTWIFRHYTAYLNCICPYTWQAMLLSWNNKKLHAISFQITNILFY